MERKGYIGISGVVNQEQQAELEGMFKEYGLDQKRTLNLGVKVTHKPQYLGIENRHGREWYPVGDALRTVLDRHEWFPGDELPFSSGVAQVCLDGDLVHEQAYRTEFWRRSIGRFALLDSGYWPRAIQFDMLPDWCEASGNEIAGEMLSRVAWEAESRKRDHYAILQCQGGIMTAHSPTQIAEALDRLSVGHDGWADYVLFDASGGRGIRMDSEALLPYIDATYDKRGVAVGGGLSAGVVRDELPAILSHFPDVSWDAEGQLHPVNADSKRPLDMEACRAYFEASAEVLR